jgi:hypothetical protein
MRPNHTNDRVLAKAGRKHAIQYHVLGEMRPGVLTMQYKHPKEKEGGFYQLSYTYRMKSKTEYVQPRFVKETKKMIENFKKFKKWTQEWVDLSLELAQLKMRIAKAQLKE